MPASNTHVISLLNTLLKNRLTAINQYFLHARILKHRQATELADYEYKASIEAMRDADMLVTHILTMGGAPLMQELEVLHIGNCISTMLAGDLALAEKACLCIKAVLANAKPCAGMGDTSFLHAMHANQRGHIDHIRASMGMAHYAA